MVFLKAEKPLRWGIIGCGDVCEVKSGPAFYKVEGSELVAVMRRNFDLAKDFAARHGVARYYSDAEALIADREVDAVYIATPPSSHLPYALKVAEVGKLCCIEKPMALNFAECQLINAAFEAKGLPVFVAYYRRSLPRFKQVKAWLDQGQIGRPQHLQWTLRKPHTETDLKGSANWRTQADIAGGGYFVDLASHGLNLFEWLLGDIQRIHGVKSNLHGLYTVEDSVCASWLFDSGATGSGSWHFGARDDVDEVVIRGDRGLIRFNIFHDEAIKLDNGTIEKPIYIKHPEHIQYVHVQNILRHLKGELTHPSLGASAARTSWLMDCILGNDNSTTLE